MQVCYVSMYIYIFVCLYRRWWESNKQTNLVEQQDPLLPGLNMTRDQQFFLSAAQIWCGSSTSQKLHQDILSNSHSVGKFRVNGVMQNMEEFSQAFSCGATTALNPATKCSLW